MVGHSIGGATASAAMVADPRIDAGVNLDGTPYVPIPDSGLDRPCMLFGTEETHAPGGDPEWDAARTHLTGGRRWSTVTDAVHFSFTGYAPPGDRPGIPVNQRP
jgi:pimeloyl-ACP methyl ester carboxylesterase